MAQRGALRAHCRAQTVPPNVFPIQNRIMTCKIEDCQEPILAKHLCKRHYYQFRPKCSVVGCETQSYRKGMCYKHLMVARQEAGDLCGFPDCPRPRYRTGLCAAHEVQAKSGKKLKPVRLVKAPAPRPVVDGQKECISCRETHPADSYWSRGGVAMPRCPRCQQLFAVYGIDFDHFSKMLKAQHGMCAVCHIDNPGTKTGVWVVDHDHACHPGRRGCIKCVRGLLCNPCNSMLGLAEDNPELLRSAIAYLENASQRSHGSI